MSLGIYVHLPYCISKCPYCDFNSYGTQGDFPEDKYLSSVLDEIELYRDLISKNSVKTVFFGGGTPSLFRSESIKKILEAIDKCSDIYSGQEISLEVNPKTIDLKKLSELKDVGINRISVGIQSFNQRKLDFYGRISNSADCEKVLIDIKKAGYQNFNIDLIYGSKDETIDELRSDLEMAIGFLPAHISVYCLTIEDGTEFGRLYKEGKLKVPNEDELLEFMVYTSDFLESAGYDNYEVSNFSKPGFECEHNLIYWRSEDYLGLGAGAHSHLSGKSDGEFGKRWANYRSPKYYMEHLSKDSFPVSDEYKLSLESALQDYLLMGLRLKEGINVDKLNMEFNKNLDLSKIDYLIEDKFLNFNEKSISFTKKGLLFANKLILNVLDALN